MPKQPLDSSRKMFFIVMCLAVVLIAIIVASQFFSRKTPVQPAAQVAPKTQVAVEPETVIDYDQLEKDEDLKSIMQARKDELGVGQGLDALVKPDESIKVGDTTVRMQTILDEIKLKEGEVVEKDIAATDSSASKDALYGIHVVQPGDNIWNIHFKLLKDYFYRKGVELSPRSDEPAASGYSSGIGKLLKFSERMVYIYNIQEKKLSSDLNLLEPLTKIVVYNMGRVFELLDSIDYQNVNMIQFDGENLWIPAEQ